MKNKEQEDCEEFRRIKKASEVEAERPRKSVRIYLLSLQFCSINCESK